jgi:branched-chain amino acid transport system ATP-binding protein
LLLDEVNAGLHGGELSEAIALIRDLAKAGLTILIIEHLMKVVTSLCTRVAVLHHGRLIADGPAEAVMNDQQVIEAYLGERYARGKGARSA